MSNSPANPDAPWLGLLRQAEQSFANKDSERAAELAWQVLALHPECAGAMQVLGLILLRDDQPAEAMEQFHRALALRSDLVPSHNGIGRCYQLLGNNEQALDHFNKALIIQPEHPFAHFNRATAWLKRGQYAEGWIEFEWRWPAGLVSRPHIPRPRWDGSPLNGRSILIHTEQGLGDVLQFMRFLPLVKQKCGRLVFACQKALQPLLKPTPCVDDWFPIDEPGEINFDLYAPLLTLPALLKIDARTIHQPIPYVFPDTERVEFWQPRIASLPGFKIGLCWQGSPTFEGDALRSIPLRHYAPLADVAGISLISLQKGAGEEQIEPNLDRIPINVPGEMDPQGAFVDRAAIMTHLDLVITSDTSVAHLAGAMGKSVWVMLSAGCDWRWLIDRHDCPWYPTMRLFRQKKPGDWATVFAEVAAVLRQVRFDV